MKKELLEQELSGMEVSEEVFNKIYNFINKQEGMARQSLETEKTNLNSDLEAVRAKNAEYEKTIESLKSKADGNEAIEKELNDLKKSIRENEKKEYESRRNAQIENAIRDVIGERKFVNDYTKDALVENIKREIDKEDNFRGISDIFNDLTKDKVGIFAEEHNMPQIPVMGKVDDSSRPTKEQFAKMKYSERVKLYENDREWYDHLTEK